MRQHLSIVLRIKLSKRNSCSYTYSPYMNNYWTEKHIEYIIHCFGNYSPFMYHVCCYIYITRLSCEHIFDIVFVDLTTTCFIRCRYFDKPLTMLHLVS